jgi:hypothetical protein
MSIIRDAIRDAMRAESKRLAEGHEARKTAINPRVGVLVDIQKAVDEWPTGNTADVIICFNGEERSFTYAEFLKACGFEA